MYARFFSRVAEISSREHARAIIERHARCHICAARREMARLAMRERTRAVDDATAERYAAPLMMLPCRRR